MSNIVFILGAGASAHAGAPLMADFMSAAEDVLRTHATRGEDARALELVQRARRELTKVHSKSQLDIRNVEAVFGAIEMARLFGRLGELTPDEIQETADAMRRLIARTLECSMAFPVNPGNGEVQAPVHYDAFADLIKRLDARGDTVSVITFNYDVGVDRALELAGFELSHFREPDEGIRGGQLELLKLHGSLNWIGCPHCHHKRSVHTRDFIRQKFSPQLLQMQRKASVLLEFSSVLPTQCPVEDCRKPIRPPLIVPPTWNKGEHQTEIRQVWMRAAKVLSEADSIIVIGYSWPGSDEFFHHLYALGTVGETFLRRFWVIDIDSKVGERFKRLLGPQASHPKSFDFLALTFEASILRLGQNLRVPN